MCPSYALTSHRMPPLPSNAFYRTPHLYSTPICICQVFYNELYVTLTQQLHASLNSIFFPPVSKSTAPSAPASIDNKPLKDVLKVPPGLA